MGLLSNLFNGKNPIDEKFEELKILGSTMRQREVQIQTRLMRKPAKRLLGIVADL